MKIDKKPHFFTKAGITQTLFTILVGVILEVNNHKEIYYLKAQFSAIKNNVGNFIFCFNCIVNKDFNYLHLSTNLHIEKQNSSCFLFLCIHQAYQLKFQGDFMKGRDSLPKYKIKPHSVTQVDDMNQNYSHCCDLQTLLKTSALKTSIFHFF